MIDLNNFLDFIKNNIEDPRISVRRKFKFGHTSYWLDLNLPNENNLQFSLHIDNRHNVIEIIVEFDDTVNIQSEEICKEWTEILEKQYQKRLPSKIDSTLNLIINTTKTEGKDFWRNWKMWDLFGN